MDYVRIKPLDDRKPALPVADGVRIGHVHLKVANLDRALSFYCDVLGFELTQRRGREAVKEASSSRKCRSSAPVWPRASGTPGGVKKRARSLPVPGQVEVPGVMRQRVGRPPSVAKLHIIPRSGGVLGHLLAKTRNGSTSRR